MRKCAGGQETSKELDSGIEIVHRWFTERGDSGYSKRLLLRVVRSVATEQTTSFLVS